MIISKFFSRDLIVPFALLAAILSSSVGLSGQDLEDREDRGDRGIEFKEKSLVGAWTGLNSSGVVVTYVFLEDGFASILEDGKEVLSSGAHASVTWSTESLHSGFSGLNIVYTPESGTVVPVRFLVRWENDGSIVLRSGGQGGGRPSDAGAEGDPMRIKLVRE